MSAVGLMTDLVDVYYRDNTFNNNTGGYTVGYTLNESGIPCAIQSAGPSETRMDGSDRGIFRVTFYVPIDTQLTANSYLSVTTGTYNGKFFTVTSAPIDDAGRGEYLRVSAELVEGFTKP